MKIPLLRALYDIHNLNRLYDDIQFTQTIHLQIKNNQLELPVHVVMKMSPNSKISNEFLQRLDQLINFYEESIYAISVQQGNIESIRRNIDGNEDLYLVGDNDNSNTHYAMSIVFNEEGIQKKSLLPIGRNVPDKYTPTIAKMLEIAIKEYNKLTV